ERAPAVLLERARARAGEGAVGARGGEGEDDLGGLVRASDVGRREVAVDADADAADDVDQDACTLKQTKQNACPDVGDGWKLACLQPASSCSSGRSGMSSIVGAS